MLMTTTRRYLSRHASLVKHFPVFSPEERHKAGSELKACVEAEEDCLGYQVESMITNISLELDCQQQDLVTLMMACNRDIKDYFPEQQKRLTLNAYNTAKQQKDCLKRNGTPYFHFTALNAFLFQNVEIDPVSFFSELDDLNIRPDQRFLSIILGHYCRNQDMDKALEILLYDEKDIKMGLNSHVAGYLIYGHCSRGEYDEASKILQLIDERNISNIKKVTNQLVSGTARCIDLNRNLYNSAGIEQLQKYMDEYSPSDYVLLNALVNVAGTEGEAIIMERLFKDRSRDTLSNMIRRPVKQLLEKNYTKLAEELVLKTQEEEMAKEMISIEYLNPSVIILADIVQTQNTPNSMVTKIYKMEKVYPNSLETAIVLLVDLSFQDQTKFRLAAAAIKIILEENRNITFRKRWEPLVSKNAKDRMLKASSENEILHTFKQFSDFGLMIKQDDVFKIALFKLIPNNSDCSLSELLSKVFETRNKLDCISQVNGGLYSTSVLWSHITKYLLTVRSEISFMTAAKVAQRLGRCYGPRRIFASLGYSVLETDDVTSFVEILEVSYQNSFQKKDGEDYREICKSLLVVINVARKKGRNIDKLFQDIVEEIIYKNLPLHDHFKIKLLQEKPELAKTIEKISVIDILDFKNKTPRGTRIRPLKLDKY